MSQGGKRTQGSLSTEEKKDRTPGRTQFRQEKEIVVSGDPFEMGLAQGTQLRERIQKAQQIVDQLESFRLMKPFWMPLSFFRMLAERKAARTLDPAFASNSPDYRLRLQGISKGSGLGIEALYLIVAMESMLSEKSAMVTVPPLGGCSALAVRGPRSATNEPVIVRNFDYMKQVQSLYTMRKVRPYLGFRSLEFTMAPFAGTVDGVNEKGLCITYNYAYTTDAALRKAAVPISILIAEALRQCSTTSEAVALIKSQPRWGGALLMIADEAGELASLELSSSCCEARAPRPGEHALFHTNVFTTTEMRAIQIPDNAVYTRRAPEFLRGRMLHESAFKRAERLRNLLEGTHACDIQVLGTIMSDHGPNGEPSDTTLCVHSPFWATTASLQLFPRSRRMRVAFDSACSADHYEIEL